MQIYEKNHSLALVFAADFLLLSLWTLARKLLMILTGSESALSDQAASILYAVFFALVPLVLHALSLRAANESAKTAFYAGAVSRLFALAAFCISLSSAQGVRLLPLIIVLSLGAAILEVAFFVLSAYSLREMRTERAVFLCASLVCLLEQAAYLIALYLSMKLASGAFTMRLMRTMSLASTAQFFLAIVKGCICAMAFGLVYLGSKKDATL